MAEFLILFYVPVLAVALYWWLVKGRPLGSVATVVAAHALARVGTVLARHSGFASPSRPNFGGVVAGWLVAAVMLALALRTSNAKKTCPACAEKVKAGAQVCKHCGHRFSVAVSTVEDAGGR